MSVNLEELREKKNLTQKEVADGCGISRSYYNQIENGVRKPSVPVAKELANFFKIEWTIFFN